MNMKHIRKFGMAGLYSTFGIILGSFFSIILFFISGGHGRELYIIAKVFFPYNWILYILDPSCSDVLTFYIFFLHWPLYGFFIGLARSKKSQCRRCFLVSLVHFSAVIYCLLDKQS
jgi:hypothetical protein